MRRIPLRAARRRDAEGEAEDIADRELEEGQDAEANPLEHDPECTEVIAAAMRLVRAIEAARLHRWHRDLRDGNAQMRHAIRRHGYGPRKWPCLTVANAAAEYDIALGEFEAYLGIVEEPVDLGLDEERAGLRNAVARFRAALAPPAW